MAQSSEKFYRHAPMSNEDLERAREHSQDNSIIRIKGRSVTQTVFIKFRLIFTISNNLHMFRPKTVVGPASRSSAQIQNKIIIFELKTSLIICTRARDPIVFFYRESHLIITIYAVQNSPI